MSSQQIMESNSEEGVPFRDSFEGPIPVIFLFGPTAVGKTDLLLELFQGRAEIISADSVQIYKHLDIGSAKPTPDYLQKLPHHLVDVFPMSKAFSVGDFVSMADQAASDIFLRGLIPVISGGTAFYFKNFYFGLPKAKVERPDLRQKLTRRMEAYGLDSLWQELLLVDPQYASTIASRDSQRIIRALEIYQHSGKPVSSFKLPDSPRSQYRFLVLGLQRPREELYERINRRVEIMMDQGLEEELHRLVELGASVETVAMKAIGYREFFAENGDLLPGSQVIELIQRNTRRYAKRQMTFFRSLPGVVWFNPEKDKALLKKRIKEFLMA